jgi:hypothetical protein
MKHFILVFVMIMFSWSISPSQSIDSTGSKEQNQEHIKKAEQKKGAEKDQNQSEVAPMEKSLEGFVDANGNGIDDRIEQKGNGKRKGQQQAKDRFIDTDGDGICDGKESAIGLKKLYRKRRGNPNSR